MGCPLYHLLLMVVLVDSRSKAKASGLATHHHLPGRCKGCRLVVVNPRQALTSCTRSRFLMYYSQTKEEEMERPITTGEVCHPIKSSSLEGGMIRGAIMLAPSTGTLEMDHPLHHPLGLHHHQQTVSHHLQGAAPWSSTQHLDENQTEGEHLLGLDCEGNNIKAKFFYSKGKSSGTSDEDEPSLKEVADEHYGGKGKRSSPWQRIKWTNNMVKLLINVVHLVGEDGTVDSSDGNKKKSSMLQKKGKWRSISTLMNEEGCYVSPQQCEDKFNDLNKRYKRLNDILGRNTALDVVDNPSLLDTMSNLSAKTKDDVKRILSSKHSFYKEMLFYHSGCKSPVSASFQFQPFIQSAILGEGRDACMDTAKSTGLENTMEEDEKNIDLEEGDQEEDAYDHHEDDSVNNGTIEGAPSPFCKGRKHSKCIDRLHCSVLDDNSKAINGSNVVPITSQDEANLPAKQWKLLRCRMMQLEEQKVGLQAQALKLEKQHFKWKKLSSKRNRELERLREDNKRLKFENDRLSLELKQKELEVECKRSVASVTLFELILERLQSKEQMASNQGHGFG